MVEFRKYRRKQIAELRSVTKQDIEAYHKKGRFEFVSVSLADQKNGSPKIGDMIARNPKNHLDMWLVAEQYFKDNFEEIDDETL